MLRVVNFFTVTEYAPHRALIRKSSVSGMRAREDRRVLHSICRNIREEHLELLDAPLRFGISADAICEPQTAKLQTSQEIRELATRIRLYFSRGLVVAPLALGNHVDHLAVNRAAVASVVNRRLGFYEDLPYATWTSESALQERLRALQDETHIDLSARIMRSNCAGIANKLRALRCYQSQITREEARNMTAFARRYGGGERIWAPKRSRAWTVLTQ